MTNELLHLITVFFACEELAVSQMLSKAEAQYCSTVYEEIKLEFLPGVQASDIPGLSHEERSAVSQAGFLAFYNWRQDHPEMVQHLQRVARGEEELSRAG